MARYYRSVESLRFDVQLLYRNCVKYNAEGSRVTESCKKLCKSFGAAIAKYCLMGGLGGGCTCRARNEIGRGGPGKETSREMMGTCESRRADGHL